MNRCKYECIYVNKYFLSKKVYKYKFPSRVHRPRPQVPNCNDLSLTGEQKITEYFSLPTLAKLASFVKVN